MSSDLPPEGDAPEPLLRLNERLRAAFFAGAEADSRRRLKRGLTREELERVLRRYPGDVEVPASGNVRLPERRPNTPGGHERCRWD